MGRPSRPPGILLRDFELEKLTHINALTTQVVAEAKQLGKEASLHPVAMLKKAFISVIKKNLGDNEDTRALIVRAVNLENNWYPEQLKQATTFFANEAKEDRDRFVYWTPKAASTRLGRVEKNILRAKPPKATTSFVTNVNHETESRVLGLDGNWYFENELPPNLDPANVARRKKEIGQQDLFK